MQQSLNRRQIKRARSVVQPDDADQHEDRARHGVEDEFHGGVNAAFVPPNADQQGHGYQHHFPEEKKEEEIQRKKHAHHADFQHQQHHKKFLHAVLDALPRCQNRNWRQERRQNDQKQTDSVNAEVVIDWRLVDPLEVFLEMIPTRPNRNGPDHQERKQKFSHGNDQRDNPDKFVIVAAQQQKRQRPHGGEENQHRKQMSARQHHRTIPRAAFSPNG